MPTHTPLPNVVWYGTINDQPVRVDYVVSAGEAMVAILLVLLLTSIWGLMVMAALDRD